MGFPPEQLDIIAEYGGQLTRAGYTAEEVQAIMAGVDTGTWNIDNLLDGLKEGRISAEFGNEVELEGTAGNKNLLAEGENMVTSHMVEIAMRQEKSNWCSNFWDNV